jgi:hypothetical protein
MSKLERTETVFYNPPPLHITFGFHIKKDQIYMMYNVHTLLVVQ